MTNFKAGDKVVCVEKFHGTQINGKPSLNIKPNGLPQVGVVYLVDKINTHVDILTLSLAGLPCYHFSDGVDSGFNARKFRKLITATERARMEREATV